jgi:transposase
MILISHSRISINDCPNFGVRINPAPTLHEGGIVVMDNLRYHKIKGIKQAIDKAGTHILYLRYVP